MGITLVINPGSSSKKFALYKEHVLLSSAYIERSENGFEMCTAINGTQQLCEQLDKQSYSDSLLIFLERTTSQKLISDFSEVAKVAVRVVAPGTFFQRHRLIDDEYILRLRKIIDIAPLHIPHLLQEIQAIKKFLPAAKVIAASDSAFHDTIPLPQRQYSIPIDDSKRYDIYHFGYHGLSVSSVLRKASKITTRKISKAIICHIGSGVSVTAVKDGKSFDTTMGYSPGSGLVMGSRAGDLPTGALLTLMNAKNLRSTDAQIYMQTNGGLKALAGESDLRLLLERRAKGEPSASEAIDSFIYHIQKAIGSFVAVMGGIDTLIFTATASERSSLIRSLVTEKLSGLNIILDKDRNDLYLSCDGVLSKEEASVIVLVVKTDEADEILRISESFN